MFFFFFFCEDRGGLTYCTALLCSAVNDSMFAMAVVVHEVWGMWTIVCLFVLGIGMMWNGMGRWRKEGEVAVLYELGVVRLICLFLSTMLRLNGYHVGW